MAVTVDELVLKITLANDKTAAELDRITSELKDLQKNSKKTAESVSDFTASFAKLSVAGYAAIKAVEAVVDAVTKVTSSFFEASDAVTRLNQALEISGSKNISGTSKRFRELAENTQNLGVAGDEQVINLARIGTAAGHSADQVEKLIKTAADLSVARDIPLDTAFRALSATLKGSASGLASFMPELKDMSAESLKAGDAIKYIGLQLGGFASRNLETFAGRSAAVKFQLDEIMETIGGLAASLLGLDKGMNGTASSLESFNNMLKENSANIVAFGETIGSYLGDIWDQLSANMKNWLSIFQLVIGTAVTWFAKLQIALDTFGKRSTKWGEQMLAFGDSLLESAAKNQLAYKNFSDGITEAGVATQTASYKLDEMRAATKKAREELAKMRETLMTPEQAAAWDTLKNKVVEFQKAQSVSGKEGIDLVRAKTAADLQELDVLYKKLTTNRKLTKEQKQAFDIARKSISGTAQNDIDKIHSDNLDKIMAKNAEIEAATKSVDATKRQSLDYELQAQLKLIDIEREKLDIADTGTMAALNAQEELLKKQTELKKNLADMELPDWIDGLSNAFDKAFGAERVQSFFDLIETKIDDLSKTPIAIKVQQVASSVAASPVGQAVGTGMENVVKVAKDAGNILYQSGGTIASALSKAGGWVGGFIDVFMNADKYLKVLIEFPKQFLQIIKNLPALVKQFVDSFPGMIRAIAEALPTIITKLVDMIPDFIAALIDALPTLIERIAEIIPEVFVKVIAMLPKLIELLVKGVAKAIQGLIKGLIRGIGRLLSGVKTPKVQLDTKQVQNAAKKLTDNASRLFNVNDLLEAAKNPMQDLTDKIEETFQSGTNLVRKAWEWVKTNVLDPIWNLVTKAWRWVWDTVLAPIAGLLKSAWQFVIDLFNSLSTVVANAFQFVKDLWGALTTAVSIAFKFVEDLWNGLTGAVSIAFKFVKDLWDALVNVVQAAFESPRALWDALKNVVAVAFKFVQDIWDNLSGVVKGAFKFVQDMWDNYNDTVKKAFQFVKDIWDGLKGVVEKAFAPIAELGSQIWEGFMSAFSGAGDLFLSLGTQIWEGLKGGLSGIGRIFTDIFDSLNPANLFEKLFRVDMGGRGTVEKALNIDIPFMSFASGGLVPGNAAVQGDSLLNDRILALLSPGEAIIPRSRMQDPAVQRLVDQIIKGDIKLPQYGKGKLKIKVSIPTASDITDALGDAVSGAGDVIQNIGDAGQVVIDQATGAAKGAWDYLENVFDDNNPLKKLWEEVKDKVFNQMVMKMFEGNRFALGGMVGTDSIPALLTPGEFVMSRPAVQSIGAANLEAMNAGKMPGSNGSNVYNLSFEINIDAKTTLDESYIRSTLVPRMSEELRRASLDGRFVLSTKGIR